MHLWPWDTSYSQMKAGSHIFGGAFPFRVRRRSKVTDAADILPALSRLERASLSPQGTRRSSDSGSFIAARLA